MRSMQTAQENNNLPVAFDDQLIATIQASIFPGAARESVIMALTYCHHAKLDIFLKPVHLVPMWIIDKATGKGGMRDVVMPGINLYRIQAARSGCAGISEPTFGEDITECLGGVDITYPKWCKVTVKRIVSGKIVEFTAIEYWRENYASAGKDKQTGKMSVAPNSMWKKRPYAQLAKCAEAQALRKGFPEIGGMPTAEEMEGKTIDSDEYQEIIEAAPTKGVAGLKAQLGIHPDNVVEVESVPDFDPETGEVSDDDVMDIFSENPEPMSANYDSMVVYKDRMNEAKTLADLKAVGAELGRDKTPFTAEEKKEMSDHFKKLLVKLK